MLGANLEVKIRRTCRNLIFFNESIYKIVNIRDFHLKTGPWNTGDTFAVSFVASQMKQLTFWINCCVYRRSHTT